MAHRVSVWLAIERLPLLYGMYTFVRYILTSESGHVISVRAEIEVGDTLEHYYN